ncbi:alpha/beta fold hydrolase [Cognatiyoonia sp. IB215446]|uniref:alpha/beta fold hydrolase n=1 Tax=Cognatiyoonia sp. IB215446 TaxID=3097355 RepID=UPI002A13BE1D|nr:alpha/beta fold hydrolase [Cognatiyoonia sp. IB215446]MDX8350327.1 alpha/beta fold hydrolase [Cognatiyoonia sp. IB215446]
MSAPLLLLPGMMCDARLYGPQLAAFSAKCPVMVVPFGLHETVDEIAAEVLAHAPPRFALAGLSMGGIVAMEVIRQAPERVTRLALLDTNPKAEDPAIAARREPQIAKVRKGGLRTVMRDEMKPNYLTDGPNTGAILDLCMAMAETLGPAAFISQSRALQSRPDQQDTLRRITVPTLVLCGEDDALCPLHRHTLMHELVPGATLTVIKGAGHLPTLEQPDATNEAIAEWLTR